jgi:ketosteroid isomerase-like protein
MTADPDLEVVRRAIETFTLEPGAFPVAELFHPEDVEIVPRRAELEGVVYRGPDAPYQFLEAMRESWESLTFEPLEIGRVGESVLALARVRARGRETGLDLDLTLSAVLRLRDGLITYFSSYSDPAEAAAAAEALR